MGKVYTRFSRVNQKNYFIHQLVQALLWRIQGRGPGGGGRPPLFVDQTEARRAEKNFFSETTPLSQGLDPALLCKRLVYWVVYSSFCHSERGICTRHKGLRENNTMFYL